VVCYGHNNNAWFPHPHLPLKAGYAAHSTQAFARDRAKQFPLIPNAPQYRFKPDSYGIDLLGIRAIQRRPAQEQVSTSTGSESPCHW